MKHGWDPVTKAMMIQRCCSVVDERMEEEKGGFDELDKENLLPQHEKQFKQSRKRRKNKTSIATRATFDDPEVAGSFESNGHTHKVASDDDTEKLYVGGLKNMHMDNKIMLDTSRRKNQVRIPHLSKEIIFNILVRLPAEIIYDVIRHVSPEWYNIVHDQYFIDVHLCQSTATLFVQSFDFPEFAHSVEVRETDINVTRIGYPFRGPVRASCDGLVLYGDVLNRYILHVANPITKQHVSLPPLSLTRSINRMRFSGLAYAASTGSYKVVHVSTNKKLNLHCLILTLGIDNAWREIDCKKNRMVGLSPISAGGFIYWYAKLSRHYFVCLDVDTEEFCEISHPKHDIGKHKWTLLAMGNLLSLVSACEEFSFEVWVLIKPKTGEWIRMPNIDLEGQMHVYDRVLFPHGYSNHHDIIDRQKEYFYKLSLTAWLKDGEMMIFQIGRRSKTFVAHNWKTGEAYSFDMSDGLDIHLAHIHSLVSFRSQLV